MYQTTIEPRVSETDGIGHINNTTVPIWFEAGRNEIFKLFTPDDDFANWKMIILNMNVDYISQIYFGTPVYVYIWVNKIGSSSLQLYEEMWQNEKLCAKDTVTYVNFNLATQTTEPITGTKRIRKARQSGGRGDRHRVPPDMKGFWKMKVDVVLVLGAGHGACPRPTPTESAKKFLFICRILRICVE